MTNTIRDLQKVREKIVDSIKDCQTEAGLMKPGKDAIFKHMQEKLREFDGVIDFMKDMAFFKQERVK